MVQVFIVLCFFPLLTVFAFDEQKANPVYVISVMKEQTKLGDIVIELFPDKAPLHCANFDSLVAMKFFDGTAFHRIDPTFMIQGGDPNSKDPSKGPETWGFGQPSQKNCLLNSITILMFAARSLLQEVKIKIVLIHNFSFV